LQNRELALGCQCANLAYAYLIVGELISLDLISKFEPEFSKNNWRGLSGWFQILAFFMVGGPILTRAYRRHLDILTGPRISDENPQHD
jgi:hypothetical protein